VSVIGHYLEDEGIATVSISLVRLHTETIRPPRALWVSFELGRPLGAPHDAGLQTRVVQSMLSLLERNDGPTILEDFPEDVPKTTDEQVTGMFCALPMPKRSTQDPLSRHETVQAQMVTLTPWYEMAVDRNQGRTTVGVSSMSVGDAVEFLVRMTDEEPVEAIADKTLGQTMRLAAEDLRAWFCESRVAQPGVNPDSKLIANWFWGETAAGQLLLDLYPVAVAHEVSSVRSEGRTSLVPRNQQHRL